MRQENIKYFKDDDVLLFNIKAGIEMKSVEIAPDVTVELGRNDEIIGIEILNVSKHFAKNIIKNLPSVDVKRKIELKRKKELA